MDNTFDKMFYGEGEFIGGIDESGVSDIAGPLVAACVILPKIDLHKNDLRIFEVNDSKTIPEKYRRHYAEIIWDTAVAIGIGQTSPSEIDYLGVFSSTKLAMVRSVAACKKVGNKTKLLPSFLIIDGELALNVKIPQRLIQHADAKSLCAAAASIVAKVYRDEIMIKLHEQYPQYGWASNKGYRCENHFKGVDKTGIQPGIHRIKQWPFLKSPKFPEKGSQWENRRKKWRRATMRSLNRSLGEDIWSTKPLLSKPSVSSRNSTQGTVEQRAR